VSSPQTKKSSASISYIAAHEGPVHAAAQGDLHRLHGYISENEPIAASRVISRLIERARALGDTPEEGRKTDERNVRVIVVPRLRYFIFYAIAEDEVHITHIRHTSRRRPGSWGG
jgi:plasmid stabilization system protein ParE